MPYILDIVCRDQLRGRIRLQINKVDISVLARREHAIAGLPYTAINTLPRHRKFEDLPSAIQRTSPVCALNVPLNMCSMVIF